MSSPSYLSKLAPQKREVVTDEEYVIKTTNAKLRRLTPDSREALDILCSEMNRVLHKTISLVCKKARATHASSVAKPFNPKAPLAHLVKPNLDRKVVLKEKYWHQVCPLNTKGQRSLGNRFFESIRNNIEGMTSAKWTFTTNEATALISSIKALESEIGTLKELRSKQASTFTGQRKLHLSMKKLEKYQSKLAKLTSQSHVTKFCLGTNKSLVRIAKLSTEHDNGNISTKEYQHKYNLLRQNWRENRNNTMTLSGSLGETCNNLICQLRPMAEYCNLNITRLERKITKFSRNVKSLNNKVKKGILPFADAKDELHSLNLVISSLETQLVEFQTQLSLAKENKFMIELTLPDCVPNAFGKKSLIGKGIARRVLDIPITINQNLDNFLHSYKNSPLGFTFSRDKKGKWRVGISFRLAKLNTRYTNTLSKKPKGKVSKDILKSKSVVTTRKGVSLKPILGMDFNADHIACALIAPDGNLLKKFKSPLSIEDKSTNQRENELSLAIKGIIAFAQANDAMIAFEELNFINKKRQLKRMSPEAAAGLSCFMYRKYQDFIKSKCFNLGIAAIAVCPSYTTQLGKIKYIDTYQLNGHLAASFVIARRAQGRIEKMPTTILRYDKKLNLVNTYDTHAVMHHAFKDTKKLTYYKIINTYKGTIPETIAMLEHPINGMSQSRLQSVMPTG